MLLQMLESQGALVSWKSRTPGVGGTKNQQMAAYIDKFGTRPGAKLKQLSERPSVYPPASAAVCHGRLPKVSFPTLLMLSRARRKREWSKRGNKIAAPADVALVERCRFVKFVETKMRCEKCSCRLRFSLVKSHQIGVCAQWAFVCEKKCVLEFKSSKPMHGNDYELNTCFNVAIIACGLSFARVLPLLAFIGSGALSTTDHYRCKAEVEPLVAAMAERRMAEAHARNIAAGNDDYIGVDGGYTCVRNAPGCTMPAHAADGAIVALAHKRLTDDGATSSQGLEALCYAELLSHPRVAVYPSVVMDGCRDLVEPTLAAAKRALGDSWHMSKNWAKWFVLYVKILCRRPPKPADEKTPNPRVLAVKVPAGRLEQFGTKPASETALEFARRRVRDLGGDPSAADSVAELKLQFGRLAEQRAMTPAEKEQAEGRRLYLAEEKRRKEVTAARAATFGAPLCSCHVCVLTARVACCLRLLPRGTRRAATPLLR